MVFLHAHPDDEAIFTGATMRLLADRGWRVVLVVATRGEAGAPVRHTDELGAHRSDETLAAAELLGVETVCFLDYLDSGLDASLAPPGAFACADTDDAAARVVELVRPLVERDGQPPVVVTYDDHGIYGHPDHVQVHRVGRAAAAALGTPTVYDATVDREYLHFVETHLVEEAGRSVSVPLGPLDAGETAATLHRGTEGDLGLAATAVGVPSVLVDTTVDGRSVIEVKRAAMLAHASQIPPHSSALALGPQAFVEVYGYEWFCRSGPPSVLDELG